jgi:hypothetical protein
MPRIPRIPAFALLLLLAALPVVGAGHGTAVASSNWPLAAPATETRHQPDEEAETQAREANDTGAREAGTNGGGTNAASWLLVSLLAGSGGAFIALGVILSRKLHSSSSVCAEPGSRWFG